MKVHGSFLDGYCAVIEFIAWPLLITEPVRLGDMSFFRIMWNYWVFVGAQVVLLEVLLQVWDWLGGMLWG